MHILSEVIAQQQWGWTGNKKWNPPGRDDNAYGGATCSLLLKSLCIRCAFPFSCYNILQLWDQECFSQAVGSAEHSDHALCPAVVLGSANVDPRLIFSMRGSGSLEATIVVDLLFQYSKLKRKARFVLSSQSLSELTNVPRIF